MIFNLIFRMKPFGMSIPPGKSIAKATSSWNL